MNNEKQAEKDAEIISKEVLVMISSRKNKPLQYVPKIYAKDFIESYKEGYLANQKKLIGDALWFSARRMVYSLNVVDTKDSLGHVPDAESLGYWMGTTFHLLSSLENFIAITQLNIKDNLLLNSIILMKKWGIGITVLKNKLSQISDDLKENKNEKISRSLAKLVKAAQ